MQKLEDTFVCIVTPHILINELLKYSGLKKCVHSNKCGQTCCDVKFSYKSIKCLLEIACTVKHVFCNNIADIDLHIWIKLPLKSKNCY